MKWKRMMAVAAMLAAVLALAACGGQENNQPQETAQQQALFDVTQFIGVDEAGLAAIMGEPDDLYVNEENEKEYIYTGIPYTYNGEQDIFSKLLFVFIMLEDGTYKLNQMNIEVYDVLSDEKPFLLPMDTDMLALFGIKPTNIEINEKAPREYLNPVEGIRFFNTTMKEVSDGAGAFKFVTVGY